MELTGGHRSTGAVHEFLPEPVPGRRAAPPLYGSGTICYASLGAGDSGEIAAPGVLARVVPGVGERMIVLMLR